MTKVPGAAPPRAGAPGGGPAEGPETSPLWVDLRDVPVKRRLPFLKAADAAGAPILVAAGDTHAQRPGALVVHDGGRICPAPRGAAPPGDTEEEGHEEGRGLSVARLVQLEGRADQERAAGVAGTVVVETQDWHVIPLENVVAARRDQGGLYAVAAPDDVDLFLQVLEVGVQGIVLRPRTVHDIQAALHALESREATRRQDLEASPEGHVTADAKAAEGLRAPPAGTHGAEAGTDGIDVSGAWGPLVVAHIVSVADVGPADRVCIDATTMFHEGEGLLVGSTAGSLALVHAETLANRHIAPRPFRVNAGAVHSYVAAAEGQTRYLAEVAAGTRLAAVRADGSTREVVVGRAKIERRPHVLVRWRTQSGRDVRSVLRRRRKDGDGRPGASSEGMAILQAAETVRLVGPDGPIAVTDLQPGHKILVLPLDAARHFGMPTDTYLEER